jgi:hypothetical protein
MVRVCFGQLITSIAGQAKLDREERSKVLVDVTGIEPVTSCLQSRRSPS